MPNLFSIPTDLPEELTKVLEESSNVRIERIVSHGQASPANFWYDQIENEWVIVLQGAARLRFEDSELEMGPGDYVFIQAGRRHRVEWTSEEEKTIWLAVFYW